MKGLFLLILLAAILFAEALLLLGSTVWFGAQFFLQTPDNLAGAILILVLTALATVWVALTASAALRKRPWMRGSALTWQLCQVAVAAGMFQGLYAQPAIGFALLIPALVAGVLLFTPKVVNATRRDIH